MFLELPLKNVSHIIVKHSMGLSATAVHIYMASLVHVQLLCHVCISACQGSAFQFR